MTQGKDPYLLTPGPLTTALATKEAMLHDWGSRDSEFIAANAGVRERLVTIAGGQGTHVCVPMQGSGTFAVEAALGTLVPRDGKALILINGAYGVRMSKILDYMGRSYVTHETPEDVPPEAADVDAILSADPAITHVLVVHCETTSGILNPVEAIAEVVQGQNRNLIVDAMSAFGAIGLDSREVPYDAILASSNKCLEGVPGMGFAIIRQSALEACQGNSHSLALDLYEQWVSMEKNKQWRFTPPTHVVIAFAKALDLYDAEGGREGRYGRYSNNCKILVEGMRARGFETLLPDALQAPIIVTFHTPADPKFHFETFYEALRRQGFVIYPGKLTVADSFRIGCIGQLGESEMLGVLAAIDQTIEEMGVTDRAPSVN